ncbi:MAG: GNAT family N-acetyltransferase [Rhodospirillales bacterium]|nr:GNAT family N-acetyltransferase [Rhodospirillales bacterium]MDH3913840.1 GNAT family N-acetyltransferase [Rhodospirillales bacterium]
MSGVTVREARAEDATGIARVHVETWRAAYAGLVPDTYLVGMSEQGQALVWQRLLSSRGRESVLVAEAATADGRQLVGFGSFGRARRGALPYKGEIYTLYVAGDWQGRGLGRRLLAGMFQAMALGGLPDTFLWVLSSNPSRFFYEAMGGDRAAIRQEAFAGTLLDETAYAWPDLAGWLASYTHTSRGS